MNNSETEALKRSLELQTFQDAATLIQYLTSHFKMLTAKQHLEANQIGFTLPGNDTTPIATFTDGGVGGQYLILNLGFATERGILSGELSEEGKKMLENLVNSIKNGN